MTGRVGIFGAGSVGTLVAARLAAAGRDVTVVARGSRLAAIREKGLMLRSMDGETTRFAVRVASAEEAGEQDILLIALKAQAIATALPEIQRLIGPQTRVVPLVNGVPWWYFQPQSADRVAAVDPHGAIAAAIDPARIVGAVLFVTSALADDGAVDVQGAERIVLGAIGGTESDAEALLAPVRALFDGCSIDTAFSDDIRRDIWAKVALNLATNPLSVVADATLYDQFHESPLRRAVIAVLEESIGVARAYGVEPRLNLEQMLEVGGRQGPFYTSMAQDFQKGAPLEMGAIGEAVLELAARVGVAMPSAQLMVDMAAHRAARRSI